MTVLEDAEQARLIERFGQRFEPGALIFAEGDEARICYLLQAGRVRLTKRVGGSERSLSVLKPGDMFGEDALLPRADRSSAASAITDVTVLALDRETFVKLLAGSPDVATRLAEQLVRRLRDAEEQLENSMLPDAPARVVNTMLRHASTLEPEPDGYVVQISPMQLASRVALDVDEVKRAVQQLRDGGYLRVLDERLLVPDLEALRRLYELLQKKEAVGGA